jgi:carbamate kinase
VVAIGGNALLKCSEPMTAEVQCGNFKIAAQALARVTNEH